MYSKSFLFSAALLLFPSASQAGTRPDYWRSDSVKVMRLLTAAGKADSNCNYMIHFARQLRGLPYVAKTLEHNPEERLVVNLRQLDCTTYTETVLALSLCMKQQKRTFEQFCHNLQQIRYRNGEVAYTNRLHYFTYWMEENQRKRLVSIVDQPTSVFSALQTVRANYMTTHTQLYPMLQRYAEWTADIKSMEQAISGKTYRYIPKSRLNDAKTLRSVIRDGDIIVILTSKRGLDTSHIGIAVWHADGLHLLNASSIHHKVVEEPKTFYRYMMEHPSHTGIRVVRMVP